MPVHVLLHACGCRGCCILLLALAALALHPPGGVNTVISICMGVRGGLRMGGWGQQELRSMAQRMVAGSELELICTHVAGLPGVVGCAHRRAPA